VKAFLFLLCCALPAHAGAGARHFTVVNAGACPPGAAEGCDDAVFAALGGMARLASEKGVRLSIFLSESFALRLKAAPGGKESLAEWRRAGHELGAWHRDTDPALAGGGPLPALAELLGRPESGCGGDGAGTRWAEACAHGASGANRSVAEPRPGLRLLRSDSPRGRGGVSASCRTFSSMKTGVYGAAFTAGQEQFGSFYAWLDCLAAADSGGRRSLTVSQAAHDRDLPVKRPAGPEQQGLPVAGLPAAEAGGATVKQTPIPKLKPVRSPFSVSQRLFFGRQGLCGDGICQRHEGGGGPAACPSDCGADRRRVWKKGK
jgi:hypothetical protein